MSNSGYEFSISNGHVVGVEWTDGKFTVSLPISSSDVFTVGTGIVTDTETTSTGTVAWQFTQDSSNTALYDLTGKSVSFTTPGAAAPDGTSVSYAITEASGTVTAISQTIANGSFADTHTLTINPTASFVLGTGSVTETLVSGHTVTTIDYVENSAGTGYVVASIDRSYITLGGATTALDVRPWDRATFTFDSAGNVTGETSVGATGQLGSAKPFETVAFTQLAPGFVEETKSFGSHSTYEVYYNASGVTGDYTLVAHGHGTTVDLVGLKAQLAELPSAQAAVV